MADTNDKETTLTEEHVIIIACVCGVIIVSLLIILFCFIFRRRRNAAKAYQGGNQGDPPPYNAVPPNKKQQVYDNQGMDTSDLQLTQIVPSMLPSAPSPSPSFVHANTNSSINSIYEPLDLYTIYGNHQYQQLTHTPGKNFQPWSINMGLDHDRVATVNRRVYKDELHLKPKYNNGMDGYPNRDAQDASGVPQSPSKDKYIGLQDRGGGDPMIGVMESGYIGSDVSAGGGKPKKVIYEVVV